MLDVQISVSEFCFRRLDFRRKECNSFQIVDQDREKHHRILRNWTDRVAMKHQRTQHRIIEEEKKQEKSYIDSFIIKNKPRTITFHHSNIMTTIRSNTTMYNQRNKIIDSIIIRTIFRLETINVRNFTRKIQRVIQPY